MTTHYNSCLASASWKEVSWPNHDYLVKYEYCLLGFDANIKRVDMLLRFTSEGSCVLHRHVGSTSTIVLEGEQHLTEYSGAGIKNKTIRKAGDYAFSSGDTNPHLESGGPNGATIFLSLHANSGVLFEYYNQNLEKIGATTVEEYILRWVEGGKFRIPGFIA